MKANQVTGYILTGGHNSRMQGQIKLFLTYRGESFLTHLRRTMQSLDRILLSVDRTEPYVECGLPMVEDRYPGIGPMGGILSGLKAEKCPLLVVSSDLPFLREEDVLGLLNAYAKKEILTIARTGERLQPLLAVYPPEACEVMEELVREKDYRMRSVFAGLPYQTVDLPERAAVNINTPEDFRSYCKEE